MGGKRVNVDSKFQAKKRVKRYHADADDDRISRLPDDILIDILSSLRLKEAARTSVLSSRWVNLWKHNSRLDFDANSALCRIAQRYKETKLRIMERRTYVKWVNSVLRSHKGRATLKEFRICFDLGPPAQRAITKWLKFAFARRVERLELDLLEYGDFCTSSSEMYVFPQELLTSRTLSFDFKDLKALCLKSVAVTDEAIDFFLRNCPFLEQLIVHNAQKLSNLQVRGSLKHLEIYHCTRLKSIKVSNAPNLTSLTLTSLEGLLLENVPMLVEFFVMGGHDNIYLKQLPRALSCCISQLETLTLKLCSPTVRLKIIECPFPFPKLKKLVVDFFAKRDESLIELASFLRTSPYLEEFVSIWDKPSRTKTQGKNNAAMPFPHLHLKVFKFLGYFGRSSDVELVRYILNNCVVLDKIIIDPHYQAVFTHTPVEADDLEAEQTTGIYAKQLEAEIPRRIEFVTL
ncbi:hypothetical protein PHJA_001453700 [Phtheirospermum japonicum]|uniref:F-box domain-containing protein n=1 Tax=Phtheirospermum japonicum TaxID=374723 RepID=A0A830C9K1_9LAMI|nr:hypothetical protein PHJA_001453700 [Phtheirospermum japonicum]